MLKKKIKGKHIPTHSVTPPKRKTPLRTRLLALLCWFVLATNINLLFGDNFAETPYSLPSFTMSIATPEAGITGWNADKSEFHIRVYDNLLLDFVLPRAASVSIKIWTEEGDLMNYSRCDYGKGAQNTSIMMDPEQYNVITPGIDASIMHERNNFLPGQKYSVQIFAYAQSSFPIILGYSEIFNFAVIKGKSQIVFEQVDGYDRGMYCEDHQLDPLDDYVEYHFTATLVDALHPTTKIAREAIEISTMNRDTKEFDFLVAETTDSSGTIEYVKRQNGLNTSLAQFKFPGSKYYEGKVTTDSLDPNHIEGLAYDYSEPNVDEISEEEQQMSITGPMTIHSLTEIRRTYSWEDTKSLFGFLPTANTFQKPFPNIGVSKNLSTLFIGAPSIFTGSVVIMSPAIYYYGNDITWANLSLLFSTAYDQNGLADGPSTAIMNVDIHLYDEKMELLQAVPFYSGLSSDFQTKTISFDPRHFTTPQALYIGIQVEILSDSMDSSSDNLDELYFCVREFDFHVEFASPLEPGEYGELDDGSDYFLEPVGTFLTPASPTIFAADDILLKVHCPAVENESSAKIANVTFFMQMADGNNLTLGTAFTASSLNTDGSEVWSWIFENLIEYEGSALFWAIVIDKMGNEHMIFTPSCEISPYSISISGYDNVLFMTPGVNISGTLDEYFALHEGDPISTNVTMTLLLDTAGGEDLILGTDTVISTETGVFDIDWSDQLTAIPQELGDIKVPIDFLQYSSATTGIRTQTNLATWGQFTDPHFYSIAFVTCQDGTESDWKVHFFEQDTSVGDSVYNWNHIEIGIYEIGMKKEALQIQTWNWDGDASTQDELVILTASEIIIISESGEDTWVLQRWSYATMGLSTIHQIQASGDSLYAVTDNCIYEFTKDSLIEGKSYENSMDMGDHGEALGVTYGEIASLGASNIVVTTENEILAWNGLDWDIIFSSLFPIRDKIIIDQLDSSLEKEILFMVDTPEFVSPGYVEIIRAAWDGTSWLFVSTGNFGEIDRVFDFKTGHLAADNFGRVIVARADDIRVDGILAPSSLPYDLNQIDSSVLSEAQAGYLVNLEPISYETIIQMERSHQIRETANFSSDSTAYNLKDDGIDYTPSTLQHYSTWMADFVDPVNHLTSQQFSVGKDTSQSSSRIISPFTANYQFNTPDDFTTVSNPNYNDFGLTFEGHLNANFNQFNIAYVGNYDKTDVRAYTSSIHWDISQEILATQAIIPYSINNEIYPIRRKTMPYGETVEFVKGDMHISPEPGAFNVDPFLNPLYEADMLEYTGFSTNHFSGAGFGDNEGDEGFSPITNKDMMFIYEQASSNGDYIDVDSYFTSPFMQVSIPFELDAETIELAQQHSLNLHFSVAAFYESFYAGIIPNFFFDDFHVNAKSVLRANYGLALRWGTNYVELHYEDWGSGHTVQYGFDGIRNYDLGSDLSRDAWANGIVPVNLAGITEDDDVYIELYSYTPRTSTEIEDAEPRDSTSQKITNFRTEIQPGTSRYAIVSRFMLINDLYLEIPDNNPVLVNMGQVQSDLIYSNGDGDAHDAWKDDYVSITPDSAAGALFAGAKISDFEDIMVTVDAEMISKAALADSGMQQSNLDLTTTPASYTSSNGDYLISLYHSIRPGIRSVTVEFYNGDSYLSEYDLTITEAAFFSNWNLVDNIHHTFNIPIPDLLAATEMRLKFDFDWNLNVRFKRLDSSSFCLPQTISATLSRQIDNFALHAAGSLRHTPAQLGPDPSVLKNVTTGTDIKVTILDDNSLHLYNRMDITLPYQLRLEEYDIFSGAYSKAINPLGKLSFEVKYLDADGTTWHEISNQLLVFNPDLLIGDLIIPVSLDIRNDLPTDAYGYPIITLRIFGVFTFDNYEDMATLDAKHIGDWHFIYGEIYTNETARNARLLSILSINEMLPEWIEKRDDLYDITQLPSATWHDFNAWKAAALVVSTAISNRDKFIAQAAVYASNIGINGGTWGTGLWGDYYAVIPRGHYLNQTLSFSTLSPEVFIHPLHKLVSDASDSALLNTIIVGTNYNSTMDYMFTYDSYAETLTTSFSVDWSNCAILNNLLESDTIIELPVILSIKEITKGLEFAPSIFDATISYHSKQFTADASGLIPLTFDYPNNMIPTTVEVTLVSAEFDGFEASEEISRQYEITLSLRGNEFNWNHVEPLNEEILLSFFGEETILIQDIEDNAHIDEYWGTTEQIFTVPVSRVSADYGDISNLEFQMSGESLIAQWVWDSSDSKDTLRNLFSMSECGSWLKYNNNASLIQIKREGEWKDLVPSINQDNMLTYSISFLGGISEYLVDGSLTFRININTTSYLTENTGYDSNYIQIDIPSIDLIFSKDNTPLFETYSQIIGVDPIPLGENTDCVDYVFSESITVQAQTMLGTPLDFAGGLIVGRILTTTLTVSNGVTSLPYGAFTTTNSTVDVVGAEGDKYEIICSGSFSFYSRDQLTTFLKGGDLKLQIEVKWEMQNNYFSSVRFRINTFCSIHVTETDWERASETIHATTHSLEVFDPDQDDDFDLLLDDGTALLFQTNTGLFPLLLQATDGDGNLICERSFFGILDIGVPHPEFVLDDDSIGSGGMPEFNQSMDLLIVDFSTDLSDLDLFLSTDGTFLAPGDENYDAAGHIFNDVLPTPLDDFFYPISIDLSLLGLVENTMYFLKVVAIDRSGNYGEQLLTFVYDGTAPQTFVSYSATDNFTVSLASDITFNFTEANTLQNFTLMVENIAHDVVYGQYFYTADQLSTKSLTLNILDDFVDAFGFSTPTFSLTMFATDKAGNGEIPQTIEIAINQAYSITYYTDEFYETPAPLNLEVYYGDTLFGIITDSIGSALPAGFEFEVQIEDLAYTCITLKENDGKFNFTILSANLYSDDLRSFPTTTITANIDDSSYITGRRIQLSLDGSDRMVETQGIVRFFMQQAISPVLIYEDLDLLFTEVASFEGIIVDLFIPWIYTEYVGTIFKEIEINFINESESNSSEDIVWSYTIDRDQISELFLQNSNPVVWGSMLVSYIPVAISWEILVLQDEVSNTANPFDLAEIDQIAITGISNDFHPQHSYLDPTLSLQALVCGGLRLIDFVNDATIYYEDNPEGAEIQYSNYVGTIQTDVLSDVLIEIPHTIKFKHYKFDSDTVTTNALTEVVAYSDDLTVSGIRFDGELFPDISSLKSELFYLSVTQPTPDIVGMPVSDGDPEEMTFIIMGRPGIKYRSLQLGFSGNALFSADTFTINSTFAILQEEVTIDMFVTDLDTVLEYTIAYGETSNIGGQILDNDGNLLLYLKEAPGKIITPFYEYINNELVLESTKDISLNNLVFGVKKNATEYYWLDNSSASSSIFQFLLDNSVDGNFPLYPQSISCAIRFLGNEFYEAKTQVVVVNIEPLSTSISIADDSTDLNDDPVTIVNGRISHTTMTSSDDLSYSFLLEESKLDGQPISDVPVWLQIGMVPRSPTLPAEISTAGVTGQYLADYPDAPDMTSCNPTLARRSSTLSPISMMMGQSKDMHRYIIRWLTPMKKGKWISESMEVF